jgi:hypothetical protein
MLTKYTQAFYCLLLLVLAAGTTVAQQTDSADSHRWYQIEVFIYANNNPSAVYEESWPKDLGLTYPEPLVALIDPEQLRMAEDETDAINSGPNLLDPQTVPQAEAPVPLLLLGAEQQQLNRIANSILRQADFRLLFHKVWRQPLNDREHSENILILGGEQFDQHYELEGTINISVERYLHIATNLWLNTFISNIGDNSSPWPLLPAIPVTRADVREENTDPFTTPFHTSFSLGSEFEALTGNQYTVERTVVMRQHRRMRSNELHYLDHPLMGLLLKITPYELPAAAATKAGS